MRCTHQSGRTRVRYRDRQNLQSRVVHVSLEIEEQVASLGPLT